MEVYSTINERWRLCTLACFIGCIILICSLNYNTSKNVSVLQSMAISVTSSHEFSSPNVQLSQPSNYNENMNGTIKGECNIFDGKWVYSPQSSPPYSGLQCPFLSDQVSCKRNGRPGFEYENWSWEAKECDIPRLNGRDMLERLRGKRVIIVGDSLNRNQWESLACLLYSAVPPSRTRVNVKSAVYKVFRAKDYKCSVEFYWSPFLVQLEVNYNKANDSRILRLDTLSTSSRKWKGADIMVFNTGHWWVHPGKIKAWDLFQHNGKLFEEMEIELAFEMAMKTWAHWVDTEVDTSKSRVFFRSISPEHKEKPTCYNRTQPIMDESYVAIFPESIIEIVKRTIGGMRTPVRYLNITKLSQYRADAHPSIYARKRGKLLITNQKKQQEYYSDCSHWCLPGVPDTWNRLLYASMVLHNLSNSTSHIDL
ncbi:PC-Esterase domain-containing protein/PMR5N domain-containing protein [Cephalotus follicularis]|uniref:PC-Esterase domain-containing protein/PMR5N domain-containing protein n=1 Tax=Cephalotus follicularis TaxID=3775 RepID=A0A1Q3AWW6_CEPFO|nr:PC-Esterase domain-containing protein/PMR5N domain-containing protein [Cephalotus follicularis]